jgi:hypothetical protein
VGGKRVLWVYDITALTQQQAQVAEQERQLREILDYSPAAVGVVDDDGRLLFHNWRLCELTATRKRNWSCSTANGSGTTSLTVRASSSCCGRAAGNC